MGASLSTLDTGNSNYDHETITLRFHLISNSWQFGGWDMHWAIEPNINWFKHRLNNPLWISEEEPNYLYQREMIRGEVY